MSIKVCMLGHMGPGGLTLGLPEGRLPSILQASNMRIVSNLVKVMALAFLCVSLQSGQALGRDSHDGNGQVSQPWFTDFSTPSAQHLKAKMEELQIAIRKNDVQRASELTRSFYPDARRVKKALRDAPSRELLEFYHRLRPTDQKGWAQLFKTSPKRSQVSVHGATTEDIINLSDIVHREFPGGAVKMASTHFSPGVTFYEVELTEPDQPEGMKYHLFFWDGEDWCMLGPIWRAKKSGRSSHRAINRKEYAQGLIEKVEAYRNSHDHLPKTVENLGLKEDEASPAYYQAKNQTDYIVWYGEQLGKSRVYDSRAKSWSSR